MSAGSHDSKQPDEKDRVDAAPSDADSGTTAEPDPDAPRRAPRGASSVAELELSLDDEAAGPSDEGDEPAVSREVQLEAQIERLQSEVDAQKDKWLRSMAEMDNFRKRSRRELQSSLNLARAELLKQMLEVLDNFDRALDAFDQAEEPPSETFIKGVRLIQDQMLRVLRENGAKPVEAAGAAFDPNLHEAVSQIETDEVESQHVAHVIKEGWSLDDMVLRPAMVVVAR